MTFAISLHWPYRSKAGLSVNEVEDPGGITVTIWLEEWLSVHERLVIVWRWCCSTHQVVSCVIVWRVRWNGIDGIACVLVLSRLCVALVALFVDFHNGESKLY